MFVIDFSPPMSGISGSFNTFRLSGAWAKRLQGGETVLLLDKKQSSTIGTAIVGQVLVGKLGDLAAEHAAHNHNQKGLDPAGAAERLIAAMIKRYGPHKCSHTSRCSVIYLRVIDEDNLQ